jgi:hypothetical protein
MNWPSILAVTIDSGEEEKLGVTAQLIQSVEHYGDYGPMAEYEDTRGRRFWIEAEYFQECKDNKVLPNIPIEVITRQEEIRQKMETGMAAQRLRELEQQTGLVLPDGYNV